MERGQHAARRLRALPAPRKAAPARLLPADGQRRRGPLHRPLLPRLRRGRCEPSHVSLFRREQSAGDMHEQLLEQRPDLRRRRQRDQPARRLARARARRDAAARLGARRGAVRAQRGLAVLVRRGRDGLPRPARAVEGLGLLPWSNCVHFDAEPERCARLPRAARRRHGRGLRGGGRRRAALRGRAAHARGQLAAGRAGLPDALDRRPDQPPAAAGRLPGRSRPPSCGRPEGGEPEQSARRIVAMGGGGFSSPARRPVARPLRARGRARAAPAHLPAAHRRRRRRGADPALLRRLPAPALRADAPVAVPARRGAGRRGVGAARPGRALRRRRQHAQPAGGVARPRRRRDPARGLGARHRAVRDQRRVDVLVRGRRDHVVRGAAPGARRWACCRAATRCTTTASRRAAPASTRRSAPRRCRPAGPWTTARGCCSPAASWWRRSAPGAAPAPTGSRRRAGGPSRPPLDPRALPGREELEPPTPLSIVEWREARMRRR